MRAEHFTQSRLQDFSDCAYRYLLRYIRRVENPTSVAAPVDAYADAVKRGSDFHRLAEQYLHGLPAGALEGGIGDATLQRWWRKFLEAGLEGLPQRRAAEVVLVAPLNGAQLTAKIDLLAFEPGRVVIVDWKTGKRQPKAILDQRIQTRVYLWVVCRAVSRTFDIEVTPDQVEMRYWFADDAGPPAIISYSQSRLDTDERLLAGLIERISREEKFERTSDLNHCRYCEYRSICHPLMEPGSADGADVEGAGEASQDIEFDLPE